MIYLTDASYDHKTGVSSISFIDKTSKRTFNKQSNDIKNIFLAELEGIKLCIIDAFKSNYSNVIIFCDNKKAVFTAYKQFKNELNLDSRFKSIQIVWLPRNFLHEADFLTKNVEDIDKNKFLKTHGLTNKLKGNVLNVSLSKNDLKEIIFKKASKIIIEDIEFENEFLRELFNGNLIDLKEHFLEESYINDLKKIIAKTPSYMKKKSDLQLLSEMILNFPLS